MSYALVPSSPELLELIEHVEQAVHARTEHGRIRGLSIRIDEGCLVVSGRTSTYYNKQLATHAVRGCHRRLHVSPQRHRGLLGTASRLADRSRITGFRMIENQIVVDQLKTRSRFDRSNRIRVSSRRSGWLWCKRCGTRHWMVALHRTVACRIRLCDQYAHASPEFVHRSSIFVTGPENFARKSGPDAASNCTLVSRACARSFGWRIGSHSTNILCGSRIDFAEWTTIRGESPRVSLFSQSRARGPPIGDHTRWSRY